MVHTNVAYLHSNGEVEGFSATRFTAENSRKACLKKMFDKLDSIGAIFDPARSMETTVDAKRLGITEEQMKTLKGDWKIVSHYPA